VFTSTDAAGQELERTVIEGFNLRLAKKVTSFECSHPGVRRLGFWYGRLADELFPQVATYQWDSYSFFTKILDDPTEYGFPDSTSYGSDKYFWGNNYHPSGTRPLFSSVPVSHTDCGPKSLSGSARTYPICRGYRKGGVEVDHLVKEVPHIVAAPLLATSTCIRALK